MWKIVKQTGYFLIIMILLPYIVTVFINGNGVGLPVNIGGSVPYVTVEKEGEKKSVLLEEYGIGMLAKEIGPEMEEETLKAQAVLIRTSIYKKIQEEGSEAVLTAEYWTRSQMKQNWGREQYGVYYDKMKNAWTQTEGEVLMYENELALTPYHQLSNGKTRSGNEVFGTEDYPYLKVKECSADMESEDAMDTRIIPDSGFEVTKNDAAGYVTELKKGEAVISGEEFRDTYHLTSACFTLQAYEGKTRIVTKGIGHGLGMSQNFANKMALDGEDYQKILSYFFEGTSLLEVAEIIVQKGE